MIPFEIHITGTQRIHAVCKELGIKTIGVELLTPEGRVIREEHMTSFVLRANSYSECQEEVLSTHLKILKADVKLSRIKIEAPPMAEFIDQSIYMESHFPISGARPFSFAASRNMSKTGIMGTERTYIKEEFAAFQEKWRDVDVEVALYDSNPQEDADWLNLYLKK